MTVIRRIREFRFEIGTALVVERQVDSQRIKGSSRIIGAHEPHFLLVALPYSFGQPMFTTSGEKCTVRWLRDGKVVGFSGQVVKLMLAPLPLMILEYPNQAEEMSLRQHQRLDCSIPTRIWTEPAAGAAAPGEVPTPVAIGGQIVDLAEGGCQLAVQVLHPEQQLTPAANEARKNIPVAERASYHPAQLEASFTLERTAWLDFELPAPASVRFPHVAGEIRWSRFEGEYFAIGLRFVNAEEKMTEAIRMVVEHQRHFFSRVFS